ncbi:MAG: MauE/DoxX family redox-associated membrane protein [Thermodesulfobacteriota bacterium]
MIHQWLSRSVRWTLAAVFLYAGMVKLLDIRSFAVIISGYGLLPSGLITSAAILLPLLEVGSAIALLCRIRGSLMAIFLQLLFFIAVLAYGIKLGLDVDCGCFGPDDPEQAYKGLKKALLRDLLLVGGVLYLYWRGRRQGQDPAVAMT